MKFIFRSLKNQHTIGRFKKCLGCFVYPWYCLYRQSVIIIMILLTINSYFICEHGLIASYIRTRVLKVIRKSSSRLKFAHSRNGSSNRAKFESEGDPLCISLCPLGDPNHQRGEGENASRSKRVTQPIKRPHPPSQLLTYSTSAKSFHLYHLIFEPNYYRTNCTKIISYFNCL